MKGKGAFLEHHIQNSEIGDTGSPDLGDIFRERFGRVLVCRQLHCGCVLVSRRMTSFILHVCFASKSSFGCEIKSKMLERLDGWGS
jgi:hypothetical protein